jgi:type I restriction enzyme M protein
MNNKLPKATRMYFLVQNDSVIEKTVEFNFYSGFSSVQKQKSIQSFHEVIKTDEQNELTILEVSRKSTNPLGELLSAFNLKYNGKYSVESIYQASKVFNDNIQFTSLIEKSPGDAKSFVKEYIKKNNVSLSHFNYFGKKIELKPESLFYDYLYIEALKYNKDISSKLMEFNCFTDIEFNHKKQISSQARSCALFVLLTKMNLLDKYTQNIDIFSKSYKFLLKKSMDLFDL